MGGSGRRRVALNMLWSVPGVGGSEEYLVRQLAGLSATEHDYEVSVFAPRGFSGRRPEIAERFTIVEAPDECTSRARRIALEHSWLARRVDDFDIVHHGGGTMPRSLRPRPSLLTVHDVQWVDYPRYVRRVKLAYLRRTVPSSLKRATRIAVPSRFVKSTLVDEFAVASSKIGIVRHGLEPWFDDGATPEAELRRRYGLEGSRVLVFPAITHPHKNHLFLLGLMSSAGGEWAAPDLKVVFAGSPGSAEGEVRAAVARLGLSERVVMPGRVSHGDRNGLLGMASAMAFPTEYEGFGAPLIEAMRCGTPVLCSDRGSVPEVVGDAGVVRPLTAAAWAEGLSEVMRHRARYADAGRKRSEMFTAAHSARDLVGQYDAVIGEASRRHGR